MMITGQPAINFIIKPFLNPRYTLPKFYIFIIKCIGHVSLLAASIRLVASHAQYRPKVRILNGSASDERFFIEIYST
jgi:hypothetical protein